MPQFLVIAMDGTDPGAENRRADHHPAHVAVTRPLVEAGVIVAGGSLLDDDGGVLGSVVMVDVDARADLDAWLAADPYVKEMVWETVDVKPLRMSAGLKRG
jgi:uncharacterized protein